MPLALLEACYSPRSKRVARPARSELLAPLEASCSPCSKRVARPDRSVSLALLEGCRSLCSKRVVRPARINTPMLFYASLPAAKLERTANQVKSVRLTYPVRPARFRQICSFVFMRKNQYPACGGVSDLFGKFVVIVQSLQGTSIRLRRQAFRRQKPYRTALSYGDLL